MIESLLGSILGDRKNQSEDDEKGKGIGSLLVIGFIVLVLFGGKLFGQTEDSAEE